jgi:threonine dehydratase
MNPSELVRNTPLIRHGHLWLKLECLQRTGSFKLRGAVAKLSALTDEERGRGVVSSSAGNHGAGLALAARALGVTATVLVPEGTPQVKRDRIAAMGATVEIDGKNYDAAEANARARAAATGAVFVSPYDDEDVIEGNGCSLAREIVEQCPGVRRVVCPVGGGGLIGGIARTLGPRGISVVGVQPEANCAMHDSLEQGRALTEYEGGHTCAEGCEGAVAQRTYELVRDHADGVVLVSEDAIQSAVAYLYREVGVVAECSAAVAMAGVLARAVSPAGDGETVIVLTGGNIDPDELDRILREQG